MHLRIRIALISTLLSLTASAAIAGTVAVYHSPDDSGTNVGLVTLPAGGTTTLHLYIDGGSTGSGGPDPCCAGQGDEILGWKLLFGASDTLTINSVAPLGDVVVNHEPTRLSMNGGNFQTGRIGPTKIADVDVQTTGDGFFVLGIGQVVGPSLNLSDVDQTIIAGVPEPGFRLLLFSGVVGIAGLGRMQRWAHWRWQG